MGDSQCSTLKTHSFFSFSLGSGSKFSTPNLDCQKWPKWVWVKIGYPNNQMINPYDIGESNTKNGLRFVVPQVWNLNPEIILVSVASHLYGEPLEPVTKPPRAGTARWRRQHQHPRRQDTGPENTFRRQNVHRFISSKKDQQVAESKGASAGGMALKKGYTR